MQAPTTPDDRPDHGSEGRTCAGCGAANGLTAAFCWQCYRPFGHAAPPPGMASAPRATAFAGSRAPTEAPDVPTTPSAQLPRTWARSRGPFDRPAPIRSIGTTLGVIAVTLAVIGGAWWFLHREAAVSMPDGFGGLTRIQDEQTALAVDTFEEQTETMGIEGEMAIYGGGTLSAALIWIRDASIPATDEAFERFAGGFDAGIGSDGSVDTSRKTSDLVNGVTYLCAPVVGVASGTICMWQDDEVYWTLFDLSGGPQAAGQELAVAAHDSIEAS